MAETRGSGLISGGDGGLGAAVVPELDPLRRRPGRGTGGSPAPSGAAGSHSWRSGSFAPSRGCAGAVRAAPRRYAILRVAKLKTMGNLHGAAQHHLRERETPNADPARFGENEILIGADTAAGIAEDWRRVAPAKFRKDAVRAVEYFVGASPEAMGAMSREDQDRYLRQSLAWIEDRHAPGTVISAIVHRDETTPHLSVIVVPVDPDTGNLNAKRWTGGKAALSAMQTDFAATVAAWGLERGQERSLARHVSIREYYARVNADAVLSTSPVPEVHLPVRGAASGLSGALGRKEPAEDYAERLRTEAEARLKEMQRRLEAERRTVQELERQTDRGRALLARAEEREAQQASAGRVRDAALKSERQAHAALRQIEGMEEGDEQRVLLKQFATQVDDAAANGALDRDAHLHFARALDEWGEATPSMTKALDVHARTQEQKRTREAGRDLEADDGWGL